MAGPTTGGGGGFMDWPNPIGMGLNGLGSIVGMFQGQPDYATGNGIGRSEWWQQQGDVIGNYTNSRNLNNQLTPEYGDYLRKAMSGQMGLSPELIQQIFGSAMQTMRPQFAQQQDQLRSSFSPRMQGSGAQAQALQQLLGQQSGGMSSALAGIDAGTRAQNMQQGLSQFGNYWGGNQQNQQAAMQAWQRWLGM
jgi:hypothetical protein